MKKIVFLSVFLVAIASIYSFKMTTPLSTSSVTAEGPVNWMTFEQAVEKAKKEPRPIMVDIFTTWCGPCKMMSHHTFGNPQIANYLNQKYYCVKFDAETFDTVRVTLNMRDSVLNKDGKTKRLVETPKEMVFVNPAPKGTPRSPHQFAASILDNQLSYPSIVFLSAKVERLDVIKGFYQPVQFEPIMKFYGSGAWQKQKYDDFLKSFSPEIK